MTSTLLSPFGACPRTFLVLPLISDRMCAVVCNGNRVFGFALAPPADVIKVRQQALGRPFLGTVRNVMTNEGVAALWRGLVPGLAMVCYTELGLGMLCAWQCNGCWSLVGLTLLGCACVQAIPASTVYLALYEVIRDRVAPMAWHEHSAAAIAPPVAGFTARAFTATFVSPLELVRTKMQASVTSKASQLTMTQGFRHIVQAEGWRGMFRGLGASIARDAPFSAVYWTTFEAGKRALAGSGHPLLTDDTSTPGNPKPTIASTLIAAASGGALSAFVTNPMDVVKTQLQTLPVKPDAPPPPSVRQQFWAILESQGVRGFYNGFAVRVARIVPATALFMASYDVLRNLQW